MSSIFVRSLMFGVSDWQQSQGFISDQMISDHLPPPGDETVVLVSWSPLVKIKRDIFSCSSDNLLFQMCGPPPMIDFACQPNLDKLAYPPDNRFAF